MIVLPVETTGEGEHSDEPVNEGLQHKSQISGSTYHAKDKDTSSRDGVIPDDVLPVLYSDVLDYQL
jgi:hypothetical protein